MSLQRASHCIYDTKYHLVWAPKYRKWVLEEPIRTRVQEVFEEIARHHGFQIMEMEVDKDHVHLFLSFPPKYSIARVVEVLKAVRSKMIRDEFPGVKQHLWGGEFWEDGYFVRTVGDKVRTDIIRKYIRFHEERKHHPEQLDLFRKPRLEGRGSLLQVYIREKGMKSWKQPLNVPRNHRCHLAESKSLL